MERFVRAWAAKIARTLGFDVEKEAVMAYGLLAITQITVTLALVLALGFAVGAPVEVLIVCLSVSILRKYSGGVHADSIEFCTVFSVVYCTLTAVLAQRLATLYHPALLLAATLVTYLAAFAIVRRYAPVDSPNKPIRSEAKIRRMRRDSLMVTGGYLALQLLCYFLSPSAPIFQSYGISLLLGVSWQAFTLTPLGAILLQKLNDLPKCLRKED